MQTSPQATPVPLSDLLGIVQVTVPVTDLARSAAWYRDLLGLDYLREFGDGERITGCALGDFAARYLVALRLRSTTLAPADLRGEHPVILEVRDAAAAARLVERATALGIPHTSGTHVDATWLEFVDPDGIALRVVHDVTGPETFMGVVFGPDGTATLYDAPRLPLPASRAGR